MSKIIREPIHIQTSEEMFEELGYPKYYENEYKAEFRNSVGIQITFIKVPKRILIDKHINMQELKAINQFCKEKGWLDEK